MSGVLTVNVDQIRQNINSIRSKIGKAKLCSVVKANCYGIGIELCPKIEDLVDYFAVANIEEALELVTIIHKPILVLSPPSILDIKNLLQQETTNIEIAVESLDVLNFLTKAQKEIKIHIVANTGMNRYGTDYNTFCKMLKIVDNNKNIKLIGVFSHFYKNTQSVMKKQMQKFTHFMRAATSVNQNVICHISNSHGIDYSLDMVRLGIEMYDPTNVSTLKLSSKITSVKKINKGEVVSYNGNFRANDKTKIAIVPLGYADGIMRSATSANVLIKGKTCPIIGDICMDCFMVDVSKIRNVDVGDNVVIFGKNGNNQISVCNLAQKCDTISYEILTRLGKRIKRDYIGADNNR